MEPEKRSQSLGDLFVRFFTDCRYLGIHHPLGSIFFPGYKWNHIQPQKVAL